MVFYIANWPGFHGAVLHERINTNTSHGLEEILQDPRKPWTSKLYSGLCVYFEKLNLELQP
jgi:hypothetical protein